jgi:hypothetical protein
MRLDDDLNELHLRLAATDALIHLCFCGDRESQCNWPISGSESRVKSHVLRSVCRVLRIPDIGYKRPAMSISDFTAGRPWRSLGGALLPGHSLRLIGRFGRSNRGSFRLSLAAKGLVCSSRSCNARDVSYESGRNRRGLADS